VKEVARCGDTLSHQDFVRRAADAGKVYAVRACGSGVFDDLRILRGGYDHLAEGWFMTVHDDVDHVFLKHAQVCLTQ
jgi:hypothetical protein